MILKRTNKSKSNEGGEENLNIWMNDVIIKNKTFFSLKKETKINSIVWKIIIRRKTIIDLQ